MWRSHEFAQLNSTSLAPPRSISMPMRRKSGTAASRKLSIPWNITGTITASTIGTP
jgi:hypothetical protein